jgi:signal transduction histidine kinase
MKGVIHTAKGEIKHILQTSFPIKTDKGYRIGSIMRDVSLQKQTEADRERLITELKTKNTELEQFTYTVSHDLKAPLITIGGFLGLLAKDVQDGNVERTQKDLVRITEATEKMQRLLNELLELSRIGRMVNPSTHVSFKNIVEEALSIVRGRLEARGVKMELAENFPVVFVDQARLVQVLQNLLDNAAKFMGTQSDPKIEIGMQGVDKDNKPIFFVKDNGIGIAPNQFERVFGLFQKLDPGIDGTGIGLALVKRIIEIHGGRIWIESAGIGHGTTFYFTISTA